MQEQTCALRALTACDGHSLELPDRALTTCLCVAQRLAEDLALEGTASRLGDWRSALVAHSQGLPAHPDLPDATTGRWTPAGGRLQGAQTRRS